jgi:hypothetical protein
MYDHDKICTGRYYRVIQPHGYVIPPKKRKFDCMKPLPLEDQEEEKKQGPPKK